MSDKSVFMGGALTESQYLFTIPIIAGYCEKKKINKIILENAIPKKILKNKNLKKILEKFNIEYVSNNKNKHLKIMFISLFQLHKILYFLLKIKFFKPSKNFLLNQYLHSIWDTSLRMMKDDQLSPSFFQVLIAIIKILNSSNYAKKIKNKNCYAAFMGHNVYSHKVIVAELVTSKVNVYCQVLYSYFKKNKKETFWGTVTLNELSKLQDTKVVNKYFHKKILGKGNYEDSNLAVKKKIKKKKLVLPKNVIFLHIFRDSPFGIIDNKRIFKDYFDWIKSTIRILNNTNEKWLFKVHPSTQRWGENSKRILKNLIDKYSTKRENIIIDQKSFSNFEIFKKADRVVTFNGTSHIESIACGLKPIIISNSTINNFNQNSYYKPKNLNEYEDLLIRKKNNKVRNKNHIIFAKKIIYFIENFKSFGWDLKVKQTYPNDSKKKIFEEYFSISKILNKKLAFFVFLGKRLAIGDRYTYSEKFYLLKKIQKKFKKQ